MRGRVNGTGLYAWCVRVPELVLVTRNVYAHMGSLLVAVLYCELGVGEVTHARLGNSLIIVVCRAINSCQPKRDGGGERGGEKAYR